jgi:hypothetical protein
MKVYDVVRFRILSATSMMITVFWDVVLRSMVEIDRRFWVAYILRHKDDRLDEHF